MTKEEKARKVWELLFEAQRIDPEEYLRAMNDQAKKAGAAEEREACAKVCEELDWSQDSTWQVATLDCAAAIRARGNNES